MSGTDPTSSESSREADRHAVIDVLNRYAEALDHRDWALLDDVFLRDATADYGVGALTGREAIVRSITDLLGGCGPTQHLLGNYQVAVDEDRARSACRIRVFHQGAGTKASLEPFECFGEYRDDLRRGADGWRIAHREMATTIVRGDYGVLGPAPE
jgi:3-phenylpropionate/cinnamic acid dioxygenase small subunit